MKTTKKTDNIDEKHDYRVTQWLVFGLSALVILAGLVKLVIVGCSTAFVLALL